MVDHVMAVTGGASGIGRAVAALAASHGARVALIDRSASIDHVVMELLTLGAPAALGIACDVGDPEQVAHAFAAIAGDLGPSHRPVHIGGHRPWPEWPTSSPPSTGET